MKKILITGSQGFLGNHLIQYVANISKSKDFLLIGIDVTNANSPNNNYTFYKCDLNDTKTLKDIISTELPDYIFHFAGLIGNYNYETLHRANATGTKNLLDIICDLKNACGYNPYILNMGSSGQYGTGNNKKFIKETDQMIPVNFYGLSKLIQENITYIYSRKNNLNVIKTRGFNVIGPGLSSNLLFGSMISQVNEQINQKEIIITLNNKDNKRDYIDIRNMTETCWKLTLKQIKDDVFNIGYGDSYVLSDAFATQLKQKLKKDIKFVFLNNDYKTGEITDQKADITKLKKTLKNIAFHSFEDTFNYTSSYYGWQ